MIVRAQSAGVVGVVSALITTLGGTLGRNLPILTARAARLPNAAVLLLAANPLVKRIALDRLMLGFTERTSATVGADVVRQQLGYDGDGHRRGRDRFRCHRLAQRSRRREHAHRRSVSISSWTSSTAKRNRTTITGTARTSPASSPAMAPTPTALAPASPPRRDWWCSRSWTRTVDGRISDVIAAIDYAVAHKSEFNIRVINMSIGAGVYESYNTDLLTLAAKRAVEEGLVVVAAAGNHGRNDEGVIQHGAISAPGNAPWVITVGASSHMGTTSRADDTIAAFSSLGPTAHDHAAKPDLVAPGVGIYSLSSPGSTLYDRWPEALLPGAAGPPDMPYLSLSGTSQAAPVVAGTVALMLQANPSLTPNAVKAILQYTAEMYDGHSYLAQGAGFLNARGAVDLALAFNTAPAARAPSLPEWSRQIIWGNHQVQGGDLIASGHRVGHRCRVGRGDGCRATSSSRGAESCSGTECGVGGSGWSTWGASCTGTECETIVWGSELSVNVVWGDTCDGVDCEETLWATSDDDIVVWGNSEEDDIVVWGNSDDDIVVWGNNDDDIVVWGNSEEIRTAAGDLAGVARRCLPGFIRDVSRVAGRWWALVRPRHH